MPPVFKHIVRPDGSIRVAGAGGDGLMPLDGELLVEDTNLRQPGMWMYDFDLEQLIEIPEEVLAARRADVAASRRVAEQSVINRIEALKRKIDNQPAALQEILLEIVEMMGLDDQLNKLKAKKKK